MSHFATAALSLPDLQSQFYWIMTRTMTAGAGRTRQIKLPRASATRMTSNYDSEKLDESMVLFYGMRPWKRQSIHLQAQTTLYRPTLHVSSLTRFPCC